MMAAAEVCGPDNKLKALAQMFRHFIFPSTQLDSSSIAVSTLYGLDPMKLDGLATELLQEWQLDIEMGNNPQSPETYVMKFTKRVEAAVDEAIEEIEEDFTSSQETLTQMMEEELFEQGLAPVASGSTLDEEDTMVPRCSNGSSTTSPIDSPLTQLSQQVLNMSPKRRKVENQENNKINAFYERLKVSPQVPNQLQSTFSSVSVPSMPPPPMLPEYNYGTLPFAINWEVWRVSSHTGLDINQFTNLIPSLQENVDSPKKLWQVLHAHAASLNETMPPTSSDKVWEILQTKGWPDGRVHVMMTLGCSRGVCKVSPRPMIVAESRRAYRKYGGDRFIALSIPKDAVRTFRQKVVEFIQKPLSICGRTYRAFFLKSADNKFTAHYFATHGAGLTEVAFDGLMEWLLSLNNNCTMAAPKLWSRISLALSSTKPTITFSVDQIRMVEDMWVGNECMTDGCARASPAVFREIWRSGALDIKQTPTAIQGRIGAAKGVWYVDPYADPRSDDIWVEIRPSQLKLKYDPMTFKDPMLRTLDVVKFSTSKFGSTVNAQLIGILSHCGVPTHVFKKLLEQDLQETLGVVNSYLDNPILLRNWVAAMGKIYEIRCSGTEYNDNVSGEDAMQEPRSITYTESGVPTMVHEAVVTLLEAGFLPKTSKFLRDKLKNVLNKTCDKIGDKMHIVVAKSTTMICIADDTGTLEEDEVSIRFGKPFMDEETGRFLNFIQGDVLVARNPALLPSDIQKVKAVDVPQLRHLSDVIVFSTKGLQSKVSLLSGGDYDGDTIWICWDERLVQPFQTAAALFSKEPPGFLSDYFEQDTRPVTEVAGNGTSISSEKFVNFGISSSLVESELGTCTVRHRDIVYTRGFQHPLALMLAHFASRLVDAPKQGLRLNAQKWNEILNGLNATLPQYILPRGEYRHGDSNHVMDILVLKVIPEFLENVLKSFNTKLGEEDRMDADILEFYKKLLTIKELKEAMDQLKDNLWAQQDKWAKFYSKVRHNRNQNLEEITLSPRRSAKRSLSEIDRTTASDLCAKYAETTVKADSISVIANIDNFAEKIKVATAYCLTPYEKTFAWSCGGFRALCEIKCHAIMSRNPKNLPPRIATEEMYMSLKTSSAFARAEKREIIGDDDDYEMMD